MFKDMNEQTTLCVIAICAMITLCVGMVSCTFGPPIILRTPLQECSTRNTTTDFCKELISKELNRQMNTLGELTKDANESQKR